MLVADALAMKRLWLIVWKLGIIVGIWTLKTRQD